MTGIIIASQVIGFISFSITLATLLGVYRDLISTMRHADTTIPITLGNLRQELEEERALLRVRCREADPYNVFPSLRRRARKQRQVAQLLQVTINKLWLEFKNIERPFLIRNPIRAEKVQKGGYWSESDIAEKPRKSKKTQDQLDLAEAGLPAIEQNHYYRTDMTHRFIWWQNRSKIESIMNHVQRIQIRRMERDIFETDELVKRCLKKLGGGAGDGRSGSSGSGSDDSDGGGGLRRRSVRSKAGSIGAPSRRGSASSGRFREVEEREVIRVRADSRKRDTEPSNTGRRREHSPRYEYEVVQPGRIVVDVGDGGGQRPRIVPLQSYNRARERDRDRRFGAER